MGNCLVVEEKAMVKMMKTDGKILEYQSPIKVHQVLSNFPGHSISDVALPVVSHLDPMAEMRGGVIRVKVVISKQELKEMLENKGLTIEDMMSKIQRKHKNIPRDDKEDGCMGWKPDLESIPEGSDM